MTSGPRPTKVVSRRYYKRRLWKITWIEVYGRLVKHYERRKSVGEPWVLVRSVKHIGVWV